MKVSTAMARINEPPPRADCNLYTKIEDGQVLVYAERDVAKDQELFLDYGAAYVFCYTIVLPSFEMSLSLPINLLLLVCILLYFMTRV